LLNIARASLNASSGAERKDAARPRSRGEAKPERSLVGIPVHFTGNIGNTREYLGILGNIWKYSGIFGNTWEYLEILGNIWEYAGIF